MDAYKTNIESLLYGYYIKYDRLKVLTDNTLRNSKFSNCNNLDIYIDLYDMFKNVYTVELYSTKQFSLVSSAINLIAHMRDFYRKYQVNTRIFLVYGDCSCNNHKQYYLNFGDKDYTQMKNYDKNNKIIESQLQMIKILCAYINGAYYVRRTTDFSLFTYDNLINNFTTPGVIITKSKYAYQLPAMCDNAYLFRPKKYQSNDISFHVDRSNVLFMFNNKIKNEKTLDKLKYINPSLLSLLITLNGLPQKKLLTLLNTTNAVSRLYRAITENKIINNYNSDTNFVYNALQLFNNIDTMNFKYRFNAVDLIYQHMIYSNMPESKDVSHIIDIQDKSGFHEIANKYFFDNPLNVNAL